MIGQPHEMATGPPLFQAWPKVVKQPARIEMIENEIAKFEKLDQERLKLLLVAELGEELVVGGEVVSSVRRHGALLGDGRLLRGRLDPP